MTPNKETGFRPMSESAALWRLAAAGLTLRQAQGLPDRELLRNVALDWVATPVNGLTMVDSAERTDAPVDSGYGFHV